MVNGQFDVKSNSLSGSWFSYEFLQSWLNFTKLNSTSEIFNGFALYLRNRNTLALSVFDKPYNLLDKLGSNLLRELSK
jgi:hypothetical protein